MKTAVLLPILVLCVLLTPITAPLVHAADTLDLLSPANGATVDPIMSGFVYRVNSDAMIKECTLDVNGQHKKTVPFNDFINKRMLYFNPQLDDNTYQWTVTCATANGDTITATPISAIVKNKDNPVTIKGSGLFRGSMAHEFAFENSLNQEPIVVNKLGAGDVVWMLFKIPPSTIKKELYIRRFSSENGKNYIILEDLKKNEEYKIFEGENTTVNVTTTTVIVKFANIELNRAVLVFSSPLSTQPLPNKGSDGKEQPTTTPTTAPTTGSQSSPEQATTGTAGTATAGEKTPTTPSTPATGSQPTTPVDDAAKPGVFKRFFSWLTSIFGA